MRRRILASLAKSGYTAKDYVQDGLVAMWDGIENAGWGVHDPNATVWKDLVGMRDMAQVSQDFEWTNLGLDVGYGEAFSNESVIFSEAEAKTFEGVFTYYQLRTEAVNMRLFNLGTYIRVGNYDMLQRIAFYRGNVKMMTMCAQSYANEVSGFVRISRGEPFSISQTFSAIRNKVIFKNGDRSSLSGHIEGSTGTHYLQCGGFGFADDGQKKGRIGCVRVYDRVLADVEIAANYAVDKARFGLT